MLVKKGAGSFGAEFIAPSRRRCVHRRYFARHCWAQRCCGWSCHGCCQPWRWHRCWPRQRRRPRRKHWAWLAKNQLSPVKNWHWAACLGGWRWPKAQGQRPRLCQWMAARRPSRWMAALRCCRSKERRDLRRLLVLKARYRRNRSLALACWRPPSRGCRSCSSGPDPAATSAERWRKTRARPLRWRMWTLNC